MHAIASLHRHGAAGRLDAAEVNARTTAVQQARTLAEIDDVLTDLPDDPAARSDRSWFGRRGVWASWAGVSLICWAIWLVDLATSEHHTIDGLWPLWVMIPWGAVILANTLFYPRSRRRTG